MEDCEQRQLADPRLIAAAAHLLLNAQRRR